MRVLILLDSDEQNAKYQELTELVCSYFMEKKFDLQVEAIGRGDLAYCIGCFGCWIKTPGECVLGGRMGDINRAYMGSVAVVYLSPVIFGQFSPNIKTVLERSLPNMLPFFEIRPDGSTMHPPRYKRYPKVIMIGCGAVDERDVTLFTDIIVKHRRNVDVILHKDEISTLAALDAIKFEYVGGAL